MAQPQPKDYPQEHDDNQCRLLNLAFKFPDIRAKVIEQSHKFDEQFQLLLEAMQSPNGGHTQELFQDWLTAHEITPILRAAHKNVFLNCFLRLVNKDNAVVYFDSLDKHYKAKQAKEAGERYKKGDHSALDDLDNLGINTAKIRLLDSGKTYSPTNLGDGQLFADTYRNHVVYVSEWKKWLKWNKKRWEVCTAEAVRRLAHKLVIDIMPEAAKNIKNDEDRAKYYKHIASSHQTFAMDSMLKEATAYLAISVVQLDADAMLFNLQNGTLDCRSGELRPHKREDMITKISPCNYDPDAEAPTWQRFIETIMVREDGSTDFELVNYLITAMGYALTGSVKEECMMVLYGNGANGKSTFLETLLYCLGDYGQSMPPSVLLADERQSGGREDIARLFGVRCAVAVETKEGGRMNCEKVKALTGGDRICARRLYENSFEFEPTHKIWLATNHEPKVDGADDGIWRRLHKVPFLASIPQEARDTSLKGKDGRLAMEADGIMTWMVKGLRIWLRDGLRKPEAVEKATAKYREDSDLFGQFLTDTFVFEEGLSIKSSELFAKYLTWANENGINFKMTSITIAKKLESRGIVFKKKSNGKYWEGLGLPQNTSESSPF